MEKHILVCSCVVLILSLSSVCGQYLPNSPCPSIFGYANQGGQVIGVIQLTGDRPVSELVLNANFTIATSLYSNFPGSLDPADKTNLIEKYNRGYPVHYRVTFPVTSPVPKLTALTVNGQTICHGAGDFPRPNQYVSTISLQHTSRSGSSVFGSRPHQLSPFPDPHGGWQEITDGGTQIFNFDNTDAQGFGSKVTKIQHTVSSHGLITDNDDPFKTRVPSLFDVSPVRQMTTYPNRLVFDTPQLKPANDRYKPIQGAAVSYPETAYDTLSRPAYDQRPITQHQPAPNRQQSDNAEIYTEGKGSWPPATEATRAATWATPPATIRAPVTQRQQFASAGNNECGITEANENIPLIYDGNPYMRGDLPWLVAIYRRTGGSLTFLCGGSLVSKRHIVTAAHCMYQRSKKTPIDDFVLKIGVHDLNDWSDDITVTRRVAKARIHENYNSSSLEDDIMVFTLDKEVTYNKYIRAVCLWSGNTELFRIVGATGNVAGWGEQAGIAAGVGEPSMVRMPIVSKNECLATRSQYHAFTNTFCAGARDGSGPCVGDSGGGMYLNDSGKWRLRGIVSSSLRSKNPDRTCELSEYIIFTDTAQYLPWIKNILNENTFD